MPRKQFLADLKTVIKSSPTACITNIIHGDEDGTFIFSYTSDGNSEARVTIQVWISDVSEYPTNHQFFIYTISDGFPVEVTETLERLSSLLSGTDISEALLKISKSLSKAFGRGTKEQPIVIDESEDEMQLDQDSDMKEDTEMEDEEFESSDNEFGQDWPPRSIETDPFQKPLGKALDSQSSGASRRLHNDLKALKREGYRISHIGSLSCISDCCLCVSIRISKLGISEEAIRAWDLDERQYLILLIRYPQGYRNLDGVISRVVYHTSSIQFHVAICNVYKPPLQEIWEVFNKHPVKDGLSTPTTTIVETSIDDKLRELFIGKPLDHLLSSRFITLLAYRLSFGMSWYGAERYYNDVQGNISQDIAVSATNPKYVGGDMSRTTTLPKVLSRDQIKDSEITELSFPLLAMQFTLRHMARCTEFCLVCHCKIGNTFEALKPYVCSNSLCLYQYMSLGFGPSIEFEIVSSPYVVDLLVSFCYVAAKAGTLQDFPIGMGLTVPDPRAFPTSPNSNIYEFGVQYQVGLSSPTTPIPHVQATENAYIAEFDSEKMELRFKDMPTCPFKLGQWVVLKTSKILHCKVLGTEYFPVISLGQPANTASSEQDQEHGKAGDKKLSAKPDPKPGAKTGKPYGINVVPYDLNFDDLDDSAKRSSICLILDTLPSVFEMGCYIQSHQLSNLSLSTWKDRISNTAIGMLRWIIASNRSCILQVDHSPFKNNQTPGLDLELGEFKSADERVHGVGNGWKQFRFAQGAPDKEQRFINSVETTTARLHQKYPTIFAWHGSGLANWHSILREGLHFNQTMHGRAYGHGVYHSSQIRTSLSYSTMASFKQGVFWPQTQLRIAQAIALNEIVNAPTEFVSSYPHLVVAQLDWIQTRYLFVNCSEEHADHEVTQKRSTNRSAITKPLNELEQDPNFAAIGEQGKLVIPLNVLSRSRRPPGITPKRKCKKGSDVKSDDELSVSTDMDDSIFLSDNEKYRSVGKGKGKEPKTDFVPGTVDYDALAVLEQPTYATPAATKHLSRELMSICTLQETQPAYELGWYIDTERISNVYQWIFELHSFDPTLPLAKDMVQKGLKSVVLEFRFGKEYPFSPPFVRVIRPRFKSFQAGGGGHVTAGGAICMELLTNTGWSSVSSLESVLLQIRLALSDTERPAYLLPGPIRDYGANEAAEAYIRACNVHGWEVPKDFMNIFTRLYEL